MSCLSFITIVVKYLIFRPIISSIVPFAVYAIAFAYVKHVEKNDAYADKEFYNQEAMLGIALLSVAYPVNKIFLWMLFRPLELLFDWYLYQAPEQLYTQTGNFGRLNAGEDFPDSYELTKVIAGKVPTDINGVYLRNGPNAKHMPKTNRNHFFDGDAYFHAVRIKEGRTYYCRRYLETPRLEAETRAGKTVYPRIGEMVGRVGMLKMPFFVTKLACGYDEQLPLLKDNSPNTAVVNHAKRTYSLVEADYPFHIVINKNEK